MEEKWLSINSFISVRSHSNCRTFSPIDPGTMPCRWLDCRPTINIAEWNFSHLDWVSNTRTVRKMPAPCRATNSDTNDGTLRAWFSILCSWKIPNWNSTFACYRDDERNCALLWSCSTCTNWPPPSGRYYRIGHSAPMPLMSIPTKCQWITVIENEFRLNEPVPTFYSRNSPSTCSRLCCYRWSSISLRSVCATSDRSQSLWKWIWNFAVHWPHGLDIDLIQLPPWQSSDDALQTLPWYRCPEIAGHATH